MTKKPTLDLGGSSGRVERLSRRIVLLSVGAASLSSADLFKKAHGLEDAPSPRQYKFRNDPDHVNLIRRRVHEGNGRITVKVFFSADRAPTPAILIMYNIPPGASEGVHTHNVGDTTEGSFDEFYYILSGSGEMRIAGEIVAVKAGDHVFTPNGVAQGIENTSSEFNLKVHLVAVQRE